MTSTLSAPVSVQYPEEGSWYVDFYRHGLAQHDLPVCRPVRALSCGSCSASHESLLAVLAELIGPRLDVHLADTCSTPLQLAAAYAKGLGVRATWEQSGAPALVTGQDYDVVAVDGPVSPFSCRPWDEGPPVALLAGLLAPGGLVLHTRLADDSREEHIDQVRQAFIRHFADVRLYCGHLSTAALARSAAVSPRAGGVIGITAQPRRRRNLWSSAPLTCQGTRRDQAL